MSTNPPWSDTFAQRFKELAGEATYRELSDKLGISKSTICAYLNGDRVPKVGPLTAIAERYGVDPMWLMGSDVPKYKQAPSSPWAQPLPGLKRAPRLGQIACGAPILAQENVECYDLVPDWAHCDFTLVCRGDSMIGARIYDGDLVCIHAQPDVESGQIAAVLVDGDEATLKRVRLYDDHVVLEPENPSHRPQVFWDEEMARVRILGRATYFISALR